MFSWDFFKKLSFVYGLFLLGESSFVFLLPGLWLRMTLAIYPVKRPLWIKLAFPTSLIFSAFVGYRFFIRSSLWALFPFLFTLVLFITLGEMFFQYKKFRELILDMILTERSIMSVVVFIEGVMALFLLALACFGF